MSDVFTEYVRCLATGREPDRSLHDEVWEHLRALLVTELRRRGLWTAPPSYLGVVALSWREPGALDELVADAFEFCLIRRQRGLVNQLELCDNIRGIIVRNVRNFISKRQREADPIGYRVFTRLRAAIEGLITQGRLLVQGWKAESETESGDRERIVVPLLDNASILSFGPFPSPVATFDAFVAPASRWNDELMPELVTAEGQAVRGVVQNLEASVSGLPDDDVHVFRLGHLAKALKDDARARWQAIWDHLQDTLPEDGEPGAPRVPVALSEAATDWRHLQVGVLACIEMSIGAVAKAKWQRDLWTVWLFLRSIRVDTDEPRDVPTYSEAGRELGLPRERISQILSELKQWVRRCFTCDGQCPAATAPVTNTPDPTPSNDDPADPLAISAGTERQTR